MALLSAGASYLPQIVGGIGAYKASHLRPKKPPIVPMPDVEALQQQSKRKAPASRGRASTILSGTDYGLGG